jgi:hypothetical protein
MMRPRLHGIYMLTVLAVGLSAGCEETVVSTRWGNFSNAPAAAPRSSSSSFGGLARDSGPVADDIPWAISIETVAGADHRQQAERRLQELAAATGSRHLWIVDKGVHSEIYHGRYKSDTERAAQADLDQWKRYHRQGLVRAPGVMLMPTHISGSAPQYDLATVDAKAIYTLEIGYYDRQYGKDFRRAAEQAVQTLRQDGLEAYYFHKADRSSVAIGAFGRNVVRTTVQRGGLARVEIVDPAVLALQQRFPKYMVNGLEFKTKVRHPDGTESFQPEPTRLAEIER